MLIPKFGLEGTIYLNNPKDKTANPSNVEFVYNETEHTQSCKGVTFHSFDPVKVRLSLDSSNVQHEKLVFQLVEPYIKGFSAEPLTSGDVEMEEPEAKKMKEAPQKGKKGKKK